MPSPLGAHAKTDHTHLRSATSDVDETIAPSTASDADGPKFAPPCALGEVGTLGPYRILQELGRGGMGAVYAALDTRLQRQVAIKVMLPRFAANQPARERFLREARAAARIKHDHVVTVYEADECDGMPYIAMEFLEGCSLNGYLGKQGNPTIAEVLRIAAEAAAGLAAAHKIGLIHRDIKPDNLWLEAPSGRVKVLDFGLAKPMDAEFELTQSGMMVGTPAYMSPEQARSEKVDHRSDLFSLGAMLYRLCTGQLPFDGPTTMAVLMALGIEEPQPVREVNPDVPEPLAALIHQLLSKRADGRPASAEEVGQRLRTIAANLTTPRVLPPESTLAQPQVVSAPLLNSPTELDVRPAATRSVPEPLRPKSGGHRRWLAAGFTAFLVVAAGVVIIIKNKDGSETKIEVPDDATVTIQGKDGKTLAQVGPGAANADRTAAESVLALGGIVQVNGESREFRAVADLPKGPFTLRSVNLSGTKVTDAGLAHFKDCKGLTSLSLDDTKVTDAGLTHFKDCKGLTWLTLHNSKVTDAGLAHFKGCHGLLGLRLYKTLVTDAGLAHFKDCKGLTLFSLSNTQVTDAGLVHFKDCKRLTSLGLSDTQVTDVGLAYFKDCKGLTLLYLVGLKVTDAGLAHFKDCKGLTELNLHRTQVTDVGLAHFKDCKGLTWLDLQNSKVTGAGLVYFKELTTLGLSGTAVTDAGLAHLKDCKRLKVLYVQKTKVSAKALAEFHAAVPDCKIEHDGGVIEPGMPK